MLLSVSFPDSPASSGTYDDHPTAKTNFCCARFMTRVRRVIKSSLWHGKGLASPEAFVGLYTSFAGGTVRTEREIESRHVGSAVGGSKCMNSLFSGNAGLGRRMLSSVGFAPS